MMDPCVEDLYLAGEDVEPGLYHRIGTDQTFTCTERARLPASFDGHVACYRKLPPDWEELSRTAVVKSPVEPCKRRRDAA